VSRLSTEDLEALRAREAASGRAGGGRAAAEARRERVARSRSAKAERKAARLAEQLRANLQKRKAQTRARRLGDADQRPEGLAAAEKMHKD
jgi:hypothetical protein